MEKNEKQAMPYLMCEYQEEPLGIQNESPRFRWQMPQGHAPQKAFQIRVLDDETGICVWDSGRREENISSFTEYEGAELESRRRYRWELQLELTDGQFFEGSSWFETGIFRQEEWKAKWIQSPEPKQRASVQMMRQFVLDHVPQKCRVYISGIGYYELYLNGRKVGDRVLEPGWTDFRRRVLYSVYDVSSLLLPGKNTLGICLGDGWYANRHEGFMQLIGDYPSWYGMPKAICELVVWDKGREAQRLLTEGGVKSGWLACDGPILENNLYDGEIYDARKEKEGWTKADYEPDSQWKPVVEAASPGGILTAQVMPPIRETREYRPVHMAYAGNRSVVVDFGQNLAGWARITVKGQTGQRVRLRYGEVLDQMGDVDQRNLRNAKAEDCYILKGGGPETYAPRFTYHGFRFVQIIADNGVLVLDTMAVAVHTDVLQTGGFYGSCETLNQIQRAVVATEQNNLHSVPTDCPQRDERLAWLNDMTVRFEEALYNFDMILFYEKWLDDISDAQNAEKGFIPDTAPYFYGNRDAAHISSVYVLLPWFLYLFYGDAQPLKKHYKGMAGYVAYKLGRRNEKGLISEQYFGEWAPPMTECILGWGENAVPSRIPAALITTGYLYYDCKIMEKAARLLGKPKEEKLFACHAREIADAVNEAYFNKQQGYYEPNIQGSNVFPLFLGIVPNEYRQKVVGHLLENLKERDYHVATGNQMTKYLFEVLRMEGYHEKAYQIASSRTYPSIGYMISCGATTIWERWENMAGNTMNSHDHPMLGAFSVWFYKALAGIEDETGMFETIHLKPAVVPEMDHVEAFCRTPGGRLESGWKRQGDRIVFRICVPWNTRVQLELPEGIVPEKGEKLLLDSGEHEIVCRYHCK